MFTGSLVALVTPMDSAGNIDWDNLTKLVDWHLQEGTHGIVAVGTTGESATLDVKEHLAVIAKVVDQVAGKIPVIAGTGANATREAIEMTIEAEQAGADAALLVTPYYNRPTQEGLFLHHEAIAKAAKIPQILYNVPGRTACDMLPETIIRLSKVHNIVAVKEATGDVARGEQVLAGCDTNFALYSGDDGSFLDLFNVGATANISVTANVAPGLMAQICEKALAGDVDSAKQLNAKLEGLHHALFLEANPIPVKWALAKMQKMSEGIRLPLTVLDQQYHQDVLDALAAAGV
ncbi:MAG: 4-hydroxy-tetrahydrodipicolinate synthase [Cellvibrionales bacterium]|nr:4-hydroxy-tetrahydrodipicolinate synthase [Cellvibrionales bacterium]